MEPKNVLLLALGGLGVAATVFAGTRLLLRQQVQASIEESPDYAKAALAAQASDFFGINIGLPSPQELADAIVPLVSTISPYEAASDITENGRSSRYWPSGYRKSDIPPQIEQLLIRVMVSASQQREQAA